MGLIVYYPFKNGSLENIITGSIATNNGAVFNNSLSKDSYYFSGIDDGMNVGTCNLTDNYTVSIWFYKSSWGTDPWETLFSLGGAELETKNGANNIATIVAYSWGGGTFTYDFDKWNHLVMTRNATETKYYLNNELRLTGQPGGYGNINILLACWNSTSSQNYKGYISNFRIYNRTLSPNEVTNLYKNHSSENNVSLIAHYPLNGNTDDYSGNGFNATNSGAIIDNNGKIGKCYSFTSYNTITTNNTNLNNLEHFTICLWHYFTDATYPRTFSPIHKNNGSTYSDGISNRGWDFGHGYSSSSVTVEINDGVNKVLSDLTFDVGNRPSDLINKWVHLTYEVNRIDKKVYAYVNGVKQSTSVDISNITGSISNNGVLRIGQLYGWYLIGKLNDIRIYNGVLSPKEIKEIAKAKILHYNFNDYQEPTTNLDNPTQMLNPMGHGLTYNYLGLDNGWQKYSISGTKPVGDNYPYTFNINCTKNLLSGNKQSMRFKMKCNCLEKYGQALTGTVVNIVWDSVTITYLPSTPNKSNIVYDYLVENLSHHEVIPQTQPFYLRSSGIEGVSFNPATDFIWLKDHQIEDKDHSTNYTPTSRTGQVQDSSGYRNHADILATKTPQWTELSKIGNGCYKFDGTDDYIEILNPISLPIYSISMWIDFTEMTELSYFIGGTSKSNGSIRYNPINNTFLFYNRTAHSANWVKQNKFTHIVFVKDDTIGKFYIDNVLLATWNISSNNGTIKFIGKRSDGYYTKGNIDDFRIYATALSQEDITELYEVGQQIHNTGTLETNQFIENGYSSLTNYNKTWIPGQVATGWSNNGPSINNSRVVYTNPWGDFDIMWKGLSDGNSGGGNAGYESSKVAVDATKKYRFSTWFRRENMKSTPHAGYIYHGTYGLNATGSNIGVYTLNNSNTTNPYFKAYNSISDNNIWRLWVGYVLPHNTTITSNDTTNGVYNIDGSKFSTATDYKWHPDTTQSIIRNYLFYSADPNTLVYFYRPRIDLCDGTEPTIEDLLKGYDHKPFPLIQPEFSEKHYTYINKYKEAFTTGITYIKDDNDVSQQLYCEYLEGEVYAKTLSGTFVVKGTIFTTIAQKIDINQFYDRVVANMDNNIIYVNKLIEN